MSDIWTIDRYQFPDRWWDLHLVRTPRGDVLPIRTRYPDGTLAEGPIVTGEFDLAAGLEERRSQVRQIIVTNLQPRTVEDPDHVPSEAAVAALEAPAMPNRVPELLENLEASVEAARKARKDR